MALPKPPSLRCLRPFSTTLRTPKPTAQSQLAPRYTRRPPPYPYGPALYYKQSDSGLYGGATIQFENKVSEKNAVKTRRTWRPNVHHKRLWSDGLGRFVQVKVQARVLRTIDKCGGLDAYLLGEKPARIKELGVEGWRLRWLVMKTGKVRAEMREEREALGLAGRGNPATPEEMLVDRKARRAEADTVQGQVERASGELVTQIQGADATLPEPDQEPESTERPIDPPSSDLAALEAHIDRTTRALEASASALASRRARSDALPSPPDDGPGSALGQSATGEEEVARIEEAVEAEMEGLDGEERERLEVAVEMLRSASEELERVRAGAAGTKGEEGGKGAEGSVLGKIMRLFWRR